jgi:hypothetical protein
MKHHSFNLLPALALLVTAPSWGQQPPNGAAAAGQPATAPREVPRPDELEPRVDTSATPPSDSPGNTRSSKAAAPAAPSSKAKTADTPTGAHPITAPATQAKAGSGKAQDRIELDATQITGNRELPKVLYIVPWKRSDLGDLVGRPPNSLLDEVLSPVDRDVFKRENRYYDALKPDAGTVAPAAAGAAPPGGGGKP